MSEAVAELRALLQKPQAGLRLLHLPLGRFNPTAEQRQAARQALRELGKTADAWRLFDMPDGDLLMLYQGAAPSAVQAATAKAAGVVPGMMPASVDVEADAAPVLRYLDGLG